jgi:hypothetical protein
MTAFLLKDIAMTSTNTGEIERPRTSFPEIGALPRDTGEYTRNLGPYVAGARLARRPGAEDTGEVPTLDDDRHRRPAAAAGAGTAEPRDGDEPAPACAVRADPDPARWPAP